LSDLTRFLSASIYDCEAQYGVVVLELTPTIKIIKPIIVRKTENTDIQRRRINNGFMGGEATNTGLTNTVEEEGVEYTMLLLWLL